MREKALPKSITDLLATKPWDHEIKESQEEMDLNIKRAKKRLSEPRFRSDPSEL